MYFPAYKFMFFHVPKTGGFSVEAALAGFQEENMGVHYAGLNQRTWGRLDLRINRAHVLPCELKQLYPELYKRVRKAAFVRNPWDRFVSLWAHLRRCGVTLEEFSFRDFTIRFMEDPLQAVRASPLACLGLPCSCWVEEGIAVYRFEDFASEFARMCQEHGLRALTPLCRINATQHRPYSTYYDKKTRDLVGEFYREDVENFGYSPPRLSSGKRPVISS
jgi:hypothetical protein